MRTPSLISSVVKLIFAASQEQWPRRGLSDLLELSNGKSITKRKMIPGGPIPVYGANGVIGNTDTVLVSSPTITVGRVGSCGEINITKGPSWVSDNAMWVSKVRLGVDQDYLYFAMKSLPLAEGAKIAAMPSISQTHIYRESIPFPAIEEQREIAAFLKDYAGGLALETCSQLPVQLSETGRIVGRVDELAIHIEEAKHLRRELIDAKDQLVNSFLSKITTELKKKFPTRTLGELLVEATYGTSSKCNSYRGTSDVPVLRIPNVASEKVSLDDLKFAPLTKRDLGRLTLREGDLLLVRTNGSADLVGRCAVVPNLVETMAFASYLIMLRCDTEILDPNFLQMILRHQRGSGALFDLARTTAGQYNVSLGRLRNAEIPVPPKNIQRGIVKQLAVMESETNSLGLLNTQADAELNSLMPSILNQAFSGRLLHA